MRSDGARQSTVNRLTSIADKVNYTNAYKDAYCKVLFVCRGMFVFCCGCEGFHSLHSRCLSFHPGF